MFSFRVPSIPSETSSSARRIPAKLLRVHVRVVRTLVVIRINGDVNLIVIAVEQRDGAARSEDIVIRMWREHQNGLVLQILQAGLLCLSHGRAKKTRNTTPERCACNASPLC